MLPSNTATTIGIRIPNVPHEVPVANARKHATKKITAGNNEIKSPATDFIDIATNSFAPRESVIDFKVHAIVRIKMAGTIAQSGFAPLLSFAAFLSINLGVINLLPLPVLDGGHLIIILAEAITGRRLPAKALMYIQMVGVALMVALFLYVTTQDIFRLL